MSEQEMSLLIEKNRHEIVKLKITLDCLCELFVLHLISGHHAKEMSEKSIVDIKQILGVTGELE